ncbi:hypothetical protein [Caballeronia sp. DA-9]
MNRAVSETEYNAAQAIYSAVLVLSVVAMLTTVIVAKLGGIL